MAPPGPLPALAAGVVTFGCLHGLWSATPAVLHAWSRILRQVPSARLLLHADPGSQRTRVGDFFAQAGVGPERITFLGYVPQREYYEQYNRIDIALAAFPYSGATTTCDALWMGVPVVTLAGKLAVGRGSSSILSNAGLPDLVAGGVAAYVAVAAQLAADLPRLAALRAGLRERLERSPLTDAPRFARDAEAAFRLMWRRWCQCHR